MTSLPVQNIIQPHNTEPMVASLQYTAFMPTKADRHYIMYDSENQYPTSVGTLLFKSILDDDIEQKILHSLSLSSSDSTN